MSIISGIDYSIIEEFRETVTAKFGEATCELPLIKSKDAATADILYSRITILEGKYTLLQLRRQQIADVAVEGKGSGIKADKEVFDALYNTAEESEQLLVKLSEVAEQVKALSLDILNFIKPYIEDVKIGDKSIYDILKESSASKINSTFICMLLGGAALKKAEETPPDSEKNK